MTVSHPLGGASRAFDLLQAAVERILRVGVCTYFPAQRPGTRKTDIKLLKFCAGVDKEKPSLSPYENVTPAQARQIVLEQMRVVSDQHDLPTLETYRQEHHTKGPRTGKYWATARGQSWKFQFITAAEAAMEQLGSREEFIREIEWRGYQVWWGVDRKNILYHTR